MKYIIVTEANDFFGAKLNQLRALLLRMNGVSDIVVGRRGWVYFQANLVTESISYFNIVEEWRLIWKMYEWMKSVTKE